MWFSQKNARCQPIPIWHPNLWLDRLTFDPQQHSGCLMVEFGNNCFWLASWMGWGSIQAIDSWSPVCHFPTTGLRGKRVWLVQSGGGWLWLTREAAWMHILEYFLFFCSEHLSSTLSGGHLERKFRRNGNLKNPQSQCYSISARHFGENCGPLFPNSQWRWPCLVAGE